MKQYGAKSEIKSGQKSFKAKSGDKFSGICRGAINNKGRLSLVVDVVY